MIWLEPLEENIETSALNDHNGNVKVVFTECAQMILDNTIFNEVGKSKCFKCSIF